MTFVDNIYIYMCVFHFSSVILELRSGAVSQQAINLAIVDRDFKRHTYASVI